MAAPNPDVQPPIGARQVAARMLAAVLDRHQPLGGGVEGSAGAATLESRDRAFARLMVATTLRRLGQIDDVIARCLDKPLPLSATPLTHLLRLGAAQLLFLGTPAHAAVDGTVELVTGRIKRWRPLANAVLRRIGREASGWVAEQDEAALNLPAWLRDSWSAAYGEPGMRAIAAQLLVDPPLDLTIREDVAGWADRLGGERIGPVTVRLAQGGRPDLLEGYAEGAWWVQDAAAALPARLLGDVTRQRVADLCAAPGGKTLQLAAAGAVVTALDRSAQRLGRLRENLGRLKLEATVIAADATTWAAPEPFDAVLLDAPCSSTGAVRRHPEVPHLKSPDDIGKLAPLQDRLLDHAVGLLRPGGLLVYCTCSLQPEEGPERVARLLGSGAAVERVAIAADEVPGFEAAVTADGDLRTLPSHATEQGGMDGFYIARLRRLAE